MMQAKLDIPLLIIGLLLTVTTLAFYIGIFPYPFGFFILAVAFLVRIFMLRSRK